MIDIINKCLDDCYEEVVNSDLSQLQLLFNKIKSEVSDNNFQEIVRNVVTSVVSQAMIYYFPEDVIIELLCKSLEDIVERLPELKKSYTFRCTLEGHEDYIYRTIEVPSYMTLDDLCCAVLGSFNADGYHMYSVDYGKKTYYCSAYHDDYRTYTEYASDYTLNELGLRKNRKMVITYDFGDNYEIVLKLEDIFNNDFIFELEHMYVLEGEGYGIWEDHHYLLDMYYWNKDEYNKAISEYEFIDNPLEEDYDFEEEDLFEDMIYFKTVFEDNIKRW